MGYDYPECFITYNIAGFNHPLSKDGDDDVTICLECLFDKILRNCNLRGRSAYYAQENITSYEKCWMCKKKKKFLYDNLPISEFYREQYEISEPEEYTQDDNSSEIIKYCCLNCYENGDVTLYDEIQYCDIVEENCKFCDRIRVACVIVR